MKASSFILIVVFVSRAALAGKGPAYVGTDNHPTGGPGATNQQVIFHLGDKGFHVEGPGKCGHLFLGGFAFGHPDPRLSDKNAVCGHGYVIRLLPPITGPAPLSILPIEPPMPVESGAQAVDAARLIRDMLPRLDKSDGDTAPVVLQIRDRILSMDVTNGYKFMPKRQPR
ncbi:MAG TPA: hypothetical protein VGP99_04915 [Tepidisphaeraceae bacterium]|nr:hypothetical protein [Tepidisphaeraceae bacterium]